MLTNDPQRNREAQKAFLTSYLSEKRWYGGKVDYYDVMGNYVGSSSPNGAGYTYSDANGWYHSSSNHHNSGGGK